MLAKDLKKSILDMAFKGELTERDSNDASAKTLLDAIGNNLEIVSDDVPYEIPETWAWTKLENILYAKPRNGYSPAETLLPTNTRNLTLTATTSGKFKPEEFKYVSEEIPEDSYLWLKEGDLLIQRSNSDEYVGTSCVYHGGDHDFIYPDLIMKMRVREEISTEYVHYALSSPTVRTYYKENAKGTAGNMPKINQPIVCNTMIPIAPYNEQLRIVEIIDKYFVGFDELEELENVKEELDNKFGAALINSILSEAMQGNLTEQNEDENADEVIAAIKKRKGKLKAISEEEITFEIPDNWKWVKLSDCADASTGDSIAEDVKLKKYTNKGNGGRAYIATKDVLFNHMVEYDNGVRIPYEEENFKVAKEGDILLCIEGGSAGRKIALLEEDVCFGNKLCDFHVYEINNRYLYYYLQSPMFTNIFRDKITGIIGGVGISKVRSIVIPVPPFEEQARIVKIIEELLPTCVDIQTLLMK